MKKLIKEMKKQGWIEKGNGKHRKFLCPCGEHILIVSRSPSYQRAEQENKAIINRYGCTYIK